MKVWFLEGLLGPQQRMHRIRLVNFPFQVGRKEDLSLVLDSQGISRLHAEFYFNDEELVLTDLQSTNGTFINRKQLKGALPVKNGDVIHFAEAEFRLIAEHKQTNHDLSMTQQGIGALPKNLPVGASEFQQLLLDIKVKAVFQTLVESGSRKIHGYEMLGRGTHPGLSEMPGPLFRLAESISMEIPLSELMRQVGMETAANIYPDGLFFTNIHPRELENPTRLINRMKVFRETYPRLQLVLEVHESAIADRTILKNITDHMHDLDIKIAYDDFGAGQARIVELAEVPPDYVKLDRSLIDGVDQASKSKQGMVTMLTDYARDNGIISVAEGVETAAEVEFCEHAKVDLMQGFYFDQPTELHALTD